MKTLSKYLLNFNRNGASTNKTRMFVWEKVGTISSNLWTGILSICIKNLKDLKTLKNVWRHKCPNFSWVAPWHYELKVLHTSQVFLDNWCNLSSATKWDEWDKWKEILHRHRHKSTHLKYSVHVHAFKLYHSQTRPTRQEFNMFFKTTTFYHPLYKTSHLY